MSDVQKLKELLAKYHAVTKKKGYDDGGVVTSDDLAPYMPSPQEEAASGFPPGPQRATYIANKKYQAAHPTPQGYAGGTPDGPISNGNIKTLTQMQNGFNGIKPKVITPGPTWNSNPKTPEPVDPSIIQRAEAAKLKSMKDNNVDENGDPVTAPEGLAKGGMVKGYADGGSVTDDLSDIIPTKNSSDEDDDNSPAPAIALPNGGLEGKELADYIKENPGPVATQGVNPQGKTDDSDDEDSDEDDSEATIKLPKSALKKAVEAEDNDDEDTEDNSIPDTKTPSLLNDNNLSGDKASVQDLLNSVAASGAQRNPSVSQGVSLADLQAAQAKDKTMSAIAGLLGGPAAQDQYLKNGNVNRLVQQKQFQTQDTQQQALQMQNQLTQYKLADEKEKNDINSPASKFAQSAVAGTYKQLGVQPPDNLFKLSASSIEQSPVLDKMLTAQSNNLTKQMIAQNKLAQMQNNQGNAQNNKQNQVMQQTQQLLESARGNPAAQQAEKDIYAAQKLNSLVAQGNLNPQMVQLAASEIAKIASGGTPTESELRGLQPNTIPSQLASLAQKAANRPIGADAQEFLKQYKQYADTITGDAQKVIQDKYGRVIQTRKNALTPENYQALQDNYVNRFKATPSREPQSVQNSPVRMQAPDGSIRLVPANQVKDAQANGGKLLQ